MADSLSIDNHKLMYHPKRVAEWDEKEDCYPLYIEVGLTDACNHKCVFCALDFLECGRNFIDKNVLITNLRYMANKGVKAIMFAGEGEPFFHKNACEFINKAKEFGIDVSVTTNGVLFTKEKIESCLSSLSWIRFSVDSGSPEKYAQIHGTSPEDFDKVIENIKTAVEFKKQNNLKITIGVQFLMIPPSINEAVKLAKILKEIGVDNLQIKPYSHHPDSKNEFHLDAEEYNKLEEQLKQFNSEEFKVIFRKSAVERVQEGINYPECYGLPFFALIDAKGNIIPCNLFYANEEFIYGNLYENSFSDIWKGEKRKEVLRKLRKKGCESCRHACRLDVINRYLYRIKNPLEHDNFV